VENSKSSLTYEALATYSLPRALQDIPQREFARRLGMHETQVSRDERNEYFGIALERAAKILDALNVRLRTLVAIEPLPPSPVARASWWGCWRTKSAVAGDSTSSRIEPPDVSADRSTCSAMESLQSD
jgi:transcriptional regulator with XRE-family HTH domain